MVTLHTTLFTAHIILGTLALIVFWIPLISKKGGLNHRKFGRYYSYTMYAVALSGALMAVMVLIAPVEVKGHLMTNSTTPESFNTSMRVFYSFLLYLSLITYTCVKQGKAVVKYKEKLYQMRTYGYITPLILLIIGGVILIILGFVYQYSLHIVFGVLGIFLGLKMLSFCIKKEHSPQQWIVEHISAMIGSGIGAFTAFIAFGGRQLFAELGYGQIIFWIAPGAIGGIAIFLLSKKYRAST